MIMKYGNLYSRQISLFLQKKNAAKNEDYSESYMYRRRNVMEDFANLESTGDLYLDIIAYVEQLDYHSNTKCKVAKILNQFLREYSLLDERQIANIYNRFPERYNPRKERKITDDMLRRVIDGVIIDPPKMQGRQTWVDDRVFVLAVMSTFIGTGVRVSQLVNMLLAEQSMDDTMFYAKVRTAKKVDVLLEDKFFPLDLYIKDYNLGRNLETYFKARMERQSYAPSPFLFDGLNGQRLHVMTVKSMLDNISKRAKLNWNITSHMFRRYTIDKIATEVNVLAAQRFASHTSYQTTLQYVDNRETGDQHATTAGMIWGKPDAR